MPIKTEELNETERLLGEELKNKIICHEKMAEADIKTKIVSDEKMAEVGIKTEAADQEMSEAKGMESMEVDTKLKEELKSENDEHPEAELNSIKKSEDADEELVSTDQIKSLKSLGPFIAAKDNSENTVFITDIPTVCKDKPCMLGVDEAGRGPVLGPMVYGIAFCPIESKQALIDLGCADSKELTEEKRDVIFDQINTAAYANSCIGWAVELISPNVISTSMFRRAKCSLNEVSMNSAIGLIERAIDAGVNIAEVYVDTVGPPEKYQAKLKAIFPQFEITVAKKADSTYPIVSAASICAKVTRDHALKVWKFPEGIDLSEKGFGSGYPGDPVTKRFLTESIDLVFGFPRLVRFSWSTAENALADKAYDVEFDEPDSEKPKYAGPKLTKFFKGASGEVKREQSRFFRERFLDNVCDF